jgi:uncharacterized protein YbjT (DUF2867 family)/ligand-binding SRPBCC domain-containing protein
LLLAETVEPARGDVLDRSSLDDALSNVEVAYYLVHSMERSETDPRSFGERDREAARNFLDAAEAAGIKRIIYLGALGDTSAGLSPHLASRIEVGEILQSGSIPTTVFRAAIIVGPWGSSFQMIQGLVEKLPVMITPRWVETLCQPIALADVLHYLVNCLDHPATVGQTLDIGGPDVLSYREMMRQFADLLGRRCLVVGVPVLTPRLSSYWVNLVTPVRASLARPLIDGLRHPVVCRDDAVQRVMPHSCLSYRDSVQRALNQQGYGAITRTDRGYNLTRRQWISQSPERLTDFFANPENLIPMTPAQLQFRLLEPYPKRLAAGSRLQYQLRIFGVPVLWQSLITTWNAPTSFSDRQLRGPYRRWDHTHTFEAKDGGSWVYDSVAYELPLGTMGRLAHPLVVAPKLRTIFDFRSRQLHQLSLLWA